LWLQKNNIKYNNMSEAFPEDLTIISLEHKLKSLGLRDSEERLTLSRYIIEPRNNKMIEFNEARSISKENAENVLKSKIDNYQIFEHNSQEMIQRVKQQVGRFTNTLSDALECEDLDGTGFITVNALKSSFHAMDILLDSDLLDYLVFETGTVEKIGKSNHLMIEYEKILKIVQNTEAAAAPDSSKNTEEDILNDESDNYGDDFEDPKESEKVDESQEQSYKQDLPDQVESQQQPNGEGDDLDEEIDDEQMISIAENCLIRIAEELLNKNITVRNLFQGEIIEEEIEGEKIELLFPTSFLDGIQKLGITDFSDLENACLMNVLAKPQLENTILLDELIDIMENLGIPENEGDSPQAQQDTENNESPEAAQNDDKPKKKGFDVTGLSEDALTLLLNFLMYLEQESMTTSNFFESVKYEQQVKTKKKQSTVDIVPADDFFRLLEETNEILADVDLTDGVKLELQELLWLEANYKDLLFLKKIDKALKEIKNIN